MTQTYLSPTVNSMMLAGSAATVAICSAISATTSFWLGGKTFELYQGLSHPEETALQVHSGSVVKAFESVFDKINNHSSEIARTLNGNKIQTITPFSLSVEDSNSALQQITRNLEQSKQCAFTLQDSMEHLAEEKAERRELQKKYDEERARLEGNIAIARLVHVVEKSALAERHEGEMEDLKRGLQEEKRIAEEKYEKRIAALEGKLSDRQAAYAQAMEGLIKKEEEISDLKVALTEVASRLNICRQSIIFCNDPGGQVDIANPILVKG